MACKAVSSLITVHQVLFSGILDESLFSDSDLSAPAEEQVLPYQLQEIHTIMSQNTPAREGMILHLTGDQEFMKSLAGSSKIKYQC